MNENFEDNYEAREVLAKELKDKILSAVRSGDNAAKIAIAVKLGDFGEHLREKYENFSEFRLYHILAGSTITKKPAFFDFPGEDSVEKFIREQI